MTAPPFPRDVVDVVGRDTKRWFPTERLPRTPTAMGE